MGFVGGCSIVVTSPEFRLEDISVSILSIDQGDVISGFFQRLLRKFAKYIRIDTFEGFINTRRD